MSNQIETKTYYGEYSLAHWIKLIKSGNIKMPEFQRKFTWRERQIIGLYNSLQDNFFIPPVIIVRQNGQNFVLDGQQRLTSIVLLAEGLEQIEYEDIKGKTLWDAWGNLFIEKGGLYGKSARKVEPMSLRKKFLGFSFISVSEKNNDNKENDEVKIRNNKYFARIFHSINSSGINLTYEQKMDALKFISIDFEKLIYPDNLKDYKVGNKKIDLIRYLVFLYVFDYFSDDEKRADMWRKFFNKQNFDISRWDQIPASLFEIIYYDFIKSLSGEIDNEINLFEKAKEHFEQISKQLEEKLNELVRFLNDIDVEKEIDKIYLADLYLFGLVNYLFIKNKSIYKDKDKNWSVDKVLFDSKFDELKLKYSVRNGAHTKKPNTINNIENRIMASIELYKSVGFDFDGEEV